MTPIVPRKRRKTFKQVAARDTRLKGKYKISRPEWDVMLHCQGSCCAICKSDSPKTINGWSTDHCHVSGKVRAILCNGCNLGLGGFKDNIESLKAAIRYLRKHRSAPKC